MAVAKYPTSERYRFSRVVPSSATYYYGRFAGNFSLKCWNYADADLIELDEYDMNLVKDVKLKDGERIFRYVTDKMIVNGEVWFAPFIKVNLFNGRFYFMTEEASEETAPLAFERRGEVSLWINLFED